MGVDVIRTKKNQAESVWLTATATTLESIAMAPNSALDDATLLQLSRDVEAHAHLSAEQIVKLHPDLYSGLLKLPVKNRVKYLKRLKRLKLICTGINTAKLLTFK